MMENKNSIINSNEWVNEIYLEKKQYKIIDNFYSCFSNVKNNKPKIIDIGCGVGYNSLILRSLGCSVVGIDINKNMIETAKKNVLDVDFYVRDITDNIDENLKFDGAVCLETFDFLSEDKLEIAFKNISSMLKSGAILLVSVLNLKEKEDEEGNLLDQKKRNNQKENKNIEILSANTIQNNGKTDVQYEDLFKYSAEKLCTLAYPDLKLVDTWQYNDFDDGWRYYIFQKQIIN